MGDEKSSADKIQKADVSMKNNDLTG